MRSGQYCYYGLSNQLPGANHTVAATFGGAGLLIYVLYSNTTAYVDATVDPALFTYATKPDYSARPIVTLGAVVPLVQRQTAVMFLVNNSTVTLTASLLLAAYDATPAMVQNTTVATGTGALSGLAIEFLSFAVLCLGVFAF
jgi:hypothetical protein